MQRLDLHRRPPQTPGFVPVVRAGEGLRHLSFGLLRLGAAERHRVGSDGEELALVLIEGRVRLHGHGLEGRELGPRPSVFEGRAGALYLPPGEQVELEAPEPCHLAVIGSPAARGKGAGAVVVTPEDVRVQHRGRPGFEREVHDIIDERVPAQRLLVGETFNGPGQWSSYPPHKHDEAIPDVEIPLEEVYYFRVEPPQGFGVQVVYSPARGVEACYRIVDGDVTLLPFGYHPVAAAPGYRVYYLWALAGEERALCFHDDPAHAWVHEMPAS